MVNETGKTYAGRYKVLQEVGRGGMAVVYKAFDERIKRTVAVKVLYPYLADREENKIRFKREAQVAANLKHRNVVSVFDYSGLDSEDNYIVAEFIEGTTLKKFRGEHRISLPEVAAMMVEQIAGALQHAHENGVTHRDVKPENVMIDADGTLKLTDFGIAQMIDFQQMTVTGTMIGSPAHMSPEHIEGRKLDHRADIFSLGTVFYVLAVGGLPFQGNSAHALLKNILDGNYVSAVRAYPPIGKALSDIIDRCMARRPEDRYQTCKALQADLQEYLEQFGFTDIRKELSQFFNEPRLYEDSRRQRVVERLVDMGKKSVRLRKVGEALRLFDRALALDEFRKDVLQEIERLRRSVEMRRVLIRYVLPVTAACLVLGGGGYAAFQTSLFGLLSPPAIGADEAPIRSIASAPDDIALPDPAHQKLRKEARSPRGPGEPVASEEAPQKERKAPFPVITLPDGPGESPVDMAVNWRATLPDHRRLEMEALHSAAMRARKKHNGGPGTGAGAEKGEDKEPRKNGSDDTSPPSKEGTAGVVNEGKIESEVDKAAAMVPVTIRGQPPAVELYVDDRKVGTGKVVGLPLSVGPHRLRLHHPTCRECMDTVKSFAVRGDGPAPHLKERIGFKPAVLLVRSKSPGIVFVNGEQAGRTNRRITLRAESPQSWQIAVKILYDDSKLPWHQGQYTLHPGKSTVVKR